MPKLEPKKGVHFDQKILFEKSRQVQENTVVFSTIIEKTLISSTGPKIFNEVSEVSLLGLVTENHKKKTRNGEKTFLEKKTMVSRIVS